MREYSLAFRDSLTNGLHPKPGIALNTPYLEECVGFIPTTAGLTSVGVLNVNESIEEWPYPQVERVESFVVRADGAHIGEANPDTHAYERRWAADSTAGRRWHVAGGISDWMAVSGRDIVRYDHDQPEELWMSDEVPINSSVYSGGRFWLGGLNMRQYTERFWANVGSDLMENGQNNTVLWGRIGAPAKELFFPFDVDKYAPREAGFIHLNMLGTIRKLTSFGTGVLAYGDRGVYFIGTSGDLGVTRQEVSYRGLRGWDSAGGNERMQMFVDSSGRLSLIRGDLSVVTVDFHHLFTEPNYFISMHEENGLWYISSSTRTYVLDEERGMGSLSMALTGLARTNSGVEAYAAASDVESYRRFRTVPMDMNRRDLKTVTSIQLHTVDGGNFEVAIDWREGSSGGWKTTPFYPVNAEGSVMVRQAGVEFRAVVRTLDVDAKVSRLDVRYQQDGRRFVRGTSAPPAQP